ARPAAPPSARGARSRRAWRPSPPRPAGGRDGCRPRPSGSVRAGAWLHLEEVAEQRLPVRSENRFGMELHAEDRKLQVPEAHHDPVLGPRADLELLGEGTAGPPQGMVTAAPEGPRHPAIERAAVVHDLL